VLALALGLGSSLCWGISDFLGGTQSRRQALLTVMLTSQGVSLAVLAAIVVIAHPALPPVAKLAPAIVAGVAGIVALTAFYRALSIGTMSIVAPIAATGVIVPVVVGIAQGERPATLQLAGIAAAVIGVALASREPDEAPAGTRSPARTSVLLALIAAAGFGTFFVTLRSSARASVIWALFVARGVDVAVLLAAAAIVRPAPPLRDARVLAALVAIGFLDLGANGLYALATRHGLLSVVSVASSLYPLATVVLARVLLGERVRRVQELGIVAALAGVVLIAAG
jgi:drug/metabolite transporter (DMT)-like permease